MQISPSDSLSVEAEVVVAVVTRHRHPRQRLRVGTSPGAWFLFASVSVNLSQPTMCFEKAASTFQVSDPRHAATSTDGNAVVANRSAQPYRRVLRDVSVGSSVSSHTAVSVDGAHGRVCVGSVVNSLLPDQQQLHC